MNLLSKGALVNFASGTVPISGALDVFVSGLGLPEDLRSASREASAVDYPTMDELLGSISAPRLLEKARQADPVLLVGAARSMQDLLQYVLALSRITRMTGSSGPLPIGSDDPEIVASGHHVFRTLTVLGQLLDRLIAWSGKRLEGEMAILGAPVLLLLVFDVLPAKASATLRSLLEQVACDLPSLQAMESLIKDVPEDQRCLLRWESLPLLTALPPTELDELRGIARAWAEANPSMAAMLVTRSRHNAVRH